MAPDHDLQLAHGPPSSHPRAASGVTEVRAGLWSIELPIPANPWRLRSVRVHAVDTSVGLVLVDAGWDAPESLTALEDGLAQLGARLADVRAVLLTHMHPDHGGLAGHIRAAGDAWVAMHRADHDAVMRTAVGGDRAELAWLQQCGVPPEHRPALEEAGHDFRRRLGDTRADHVLHDGDRPVSGAALRVLHTPGHTPGHVCFHDPDRQALFSGDHLLGATTPNVPHDAVTRGDALGDYLRSLELVGRVDGALVLPGHGDPFSGVASRADATTRHHVAQLRAVSKHLRSAPSSTTWEVASSLPWSTDFLALPPHARRAALAETQAHVVHLWRRRGICALGENPIRWMMAAPPR